VLATFSFHKEAIYRDLQENERAVLTDPMVQVLALGPDAPSGSRGAPYGSCGWFGDDIGPPW